jgi:hypothetical protein
VTFEAGRGWQLMLDQARAIEIWVALESMSALHCILGR